MKRAAVERQDRLMRVVAPMIFAGARPGEAHLEFDLAELVDPIVRQSAHRLAGAAGALALLGSVARVLGVDLLLGPSRALRR